MKLIYDPLFIFRKSKSPIGLYARQKWLGEEGEKEWGQDFRSTLHFLTRNQLGNGSWNNDIVLTVRHLFGLHLTQRETEGRVEKALHWLLDETINTFSLSPRGKGLPRMIPQDLYALPFTADRQDRFAQASTLFLFTVFERAGESLILDWYDQACRKIEKSGGVYFSQSSTINMFRALAVHPRFSGSPAAEMITDRLAALQTPTGQWPTPFPYYQTVNVLAHLEFQSADNQIKTAFQTLMKNQNKDGTWGRSQREWNTFLVVHALKRKAR